ncbi:MAG: hypothetical protein ACD_84C00040G0006 [uncultured bacterium]|nr:MAG: hypothetical protein ACD_84C00040G0006 [uncultured bacterium]
MEVFYWADGTWVLKQEFTNDGYSWKGQNYGTLTVPVSATDGVIDALVRNALN